jgi:hypothetical protein
MSDINEKEAKWQAILAKSYKDYLITVACCCVGWFMFNMGMYASTNPGGNLFVMFIGYVIIGGPVLLRILLSKSAGSLFFWKDYEVVTTYSDGSKKSDGGVESAQMNMIMMAIILAICLVLGGIITAIKVIWLSVKTITCYVAVKQKPNFLFSSFPVLIMGLVVLVFGLVIPQKIGDARRYAAKVEEYNTYNKAQEISPEEVRTIIAEAAKSFLAQDRDIWNYTDQGGFHVNYHAADGTTELRAEKYKGKSAYAIGTYYFAGTNFTKFEDTFNTRKQPGQSDIEGVKKYLPVVFVDTLSQVQDSDLFAGKLGGGMGAINYMFGIHGLDYKKRTGVQIVFLNGKYDFRGSVTSGISTFGYL